jgi:hypothetical protein
VRVVADKAIPSPAGEPLITWEPDPTNPLKASLYPARDHGYVLDIADAGAYLINPEEGLIVIPPDTPRLLAEVRLLGLPLMLCFLHRGDLSLHAAAVEVPSGALLIAAPGRHGKTSLAATFAKHGHRLLTEDLSCITPSLAPVLTPGPATLRIRPDMAEVLPVPDMVDIGRLDDRLVLASTAPGECQPIPIAGIVLLKDFGDELSIERTDGTAVLPDLWFLSLHIPSQSDRERKFTQLVDLAATTPIWSVVQPRGAGRIVETVAALTETVTS